MWIWYISRIFCNFRRGCPPLTTNKPAGLLSCHSCPLRVSRSYIWAGMVRICLDSTSSANGATAWLGCRCVISARSDMVRSLCFCGIFLNIDDFWRIDRRLRAKNTIGAGKWGSAVVIIVSAVLERISPEIESTSAAYRLQSARLSGGKSSTLTCPLGCNSCSPILYY